MLPAPSDLTYFLEVSNTLNISRAAERLGISQPSLSLAMQRLEKAIGTPLILRSKSGVRLTRAGQKFAARTRSLLQEWDNIRAEAIKDESEVVGRYMIGCHASVGLYTLPHFLPQLVQSHPHLEFRLTHDLSRRITEDVISFKIDFGIVVNPVTHPDLVIRPLCKDEFTFWTRKNPSPTQLIDGDQAVLICEPDLVQTETLLKQWDKKGAAFRRIITSPNLEVITSMVAAGVGIGLLPGRVAARIESLGLKPMGGSSPKFLDQVCLVYRADTQKSRAARVIAAAIESGVKEALPQS